MFPPGEQTAVHPDASSDTEQRRRLQNKVCRNKVRDDAEIIYSIRCHKWQVWSWCFSRQLHPLWIKVPTMSGTTTIAYLSSFHDSASARSSSSSSSLAPSGHRAAMFRWESGGWMNELRNPSHDMKTDKYLTPVCLFDWAETIWAWRVVSHWCKLSPGESDMDVSRLIFQVPQLHPDQVLDIPEVFKSILQIGEQM